MALNLITTDDLSRSLSDNAGFDVRLAEWAIETVSATARDIAARPEWDAENCPPAVRAVCGLAARRLYSNPDRFTRESDGDYSYSLDASVTNAAVFTPSEIGTLRKFAPGSGMGGLRVMSTTREPEPALDGYVPDGTADGFPWYGDGRWGWAV